MFGPRYFGPTYFGGRFFGAGGDAAPPGASASQVWAYVLGNGKSAGQNLVEINEGIAALLASPNCLETPVQGPYTALDALRILLAVAAGKTTITPAGGGAALVEFRAADDSNTTVSAQMQGSARIAVTLDPQESS
jgi:hypothetical protein